VLALLTALLTSLAVLAALPPVLIRIVCHLYSFIVAERELTRRCGYVWHSVLVAKSCPQGCG